MVVPKQRSEVVWVPDCAGLASGSVLLRLGPCTPARHCRPLEANTWVEWRNTVPEWEGKANPPFICLVLKKNLNNRFNLDLCHLMQIVYRYSCGTPFR